MSGEISLKQFFLHEDRELDPESRNELEKSDRMAAVRKTIREQHHDLHWPAVADEVVASLSGLLDIRWRDILRRGWEKGAAVEEKLRQSAQSPGETILMPLAEHAIVSRHNPTVELLLNDRHLADISFRIEVRVEIEGAVLKIRDGGIREVATGTCRAGGSLQCEQAVLLEKKTEKLNLPGTMVFD